MNLFLSFSDSAKFALVAKNLIFGNGFVSDFSFWHKGIFENLKSGFAFSYPPLMPFSIALFFKIFGISDFAVVATSFFFYLLSLIFIFLLAKNIFGSRLIGVLSLIAIGANYDLIHYALSGASESLFILEVVLSFYFLSLRKKWGDLIGFFVLLLMYFTRFHSFIYIFGALLFWLFLHFELKKAIVYFLLVLFFGAVFDRLVLYPLSGKFFLYSIFGAGSYAVLQHNLSWAVSDALRGLPSQSFDFLSLFKKVFYNLYNFYKLMPQILNPYLFALFAISLFLWTKKKLEDSFKVASFFVFVLNFLTVALSIPLFRYLHPVIPFVYILGVKTLVGVLAFSLKNSRQLFLSLSSLALVLVFGIGQTLGIFLLDSRFEVKIKNIGKPPVYFQLSKILKENTKPDQIVLTNLDTWGSWYGERKTIWFPLKPEMIIDPKTGDIPFDVIYLTSYKIDDPNYYMGDEWRLIFENPKDTSKWLCNGCEKIAKDFALKEKFTLDKEDNYEREEAKAILFIKKN